jgi:hypothetical protein
MSLKEDFEPDFINTFANEEEFGTAKVDGTPGMDFEIIENRVPKRFTAKCVWDVFSFQNREAQFQQGIYIGTVLWFIAKSWFVVEPKPEQIVYTFERNDIGEERKVGWRVLHVVDAESVYEINLDRQRSS